MAEEVGGGKTRKRRITSADYDRLSEFVLQEKKDRQQKRKDKERLWDEVDRQVGMRPENKWKYDRAGRLIASTVWMSELELPLQAEALEVLKSDAKRMILPANGAWFRARTLVDDEYLDRVDFTSLIAGDQNEVPSKVLQEDADKLLEGWHQNFHRQYDFQGNWDRLNGEAFKYGTFVGRGRAVRKRIFLQTAKGTVKRDVVMPILVPRSIRNVYLDDSQHRMANEGSWVAPATIATFKQRLTDLTLAAVRGSKDPDNPQGGWLPNNLKGVEPNEDGLVTVSEYEGDMDIPRRTTKSIYIPNVIVTVVEGKGSQGVVRIRFNPISTGSYVSQSYDPEQADSPYSTSVLMKASSIQSAATMAFNRLVDWGILNIQPPIKYDNQDPAFARAGGPVIQPAELWPSLGDVEPVQIGDGVAMLQLYSAMLAQYSDLTGISAPRLGAQTVSHTTAFAKDAELSRGQVRTVDYAQHTMENAMTRWLYMEAEIGRKSMSGEMTFYIPSYQAYVSLKKDQLPEEAVYEVFGAAGPAVNQADEQQKAAALQLALQIEAFKLQSDPEARKLDTVALQEQILRSGGFADIDPFFADDAGTQPTEAGPGVQPGVVTSGDPGLALLEGGI